MVNLEAKKKDGNITLTEDCFEHLLNCLDNQKFITLPDKQSDWEKEEIQEYIDDFNTQCRHFWLSDDEEKDWTFDADQSDEIKKFKESIGNSAIKWIEVGD